DGIRDRNVTGVQTCALPIYKTPREVINHRKAFFSLETVEKAVAIVKKRRTMRYVAAAEGTIMVPEYLAPSLTILLPARVNSTPVIFCTMMTRLCVSKPTRRTVRTVCSPLR